MNRAGAIIVIASLVAISSPALAGKKKSKKKAKVATEQVEAPRRLCDELGLGITLAAPTGDAGKPTEEIAQQDADALARAESFDLSRLGRSSSMPAGEDTVRLVGEPLTGAQVGDVVHSKNGELEFCWNKLSSAQRADGLALTLRFTIETRGKVSALEIEGDAPAKLSSCIKATAKRWTFPVADMQTLAEYPIVLN